jgi:integrase/recombinase XerD
MLTTFRRHSHDCRYQSRRFRDCKCAIWVDGVIAGREIRKSLKTRNWRKAQKLVLRMEADDTEPGERTTIDKACESFLQDATARGLRTSSLKRYDPLFNRLKAFAENEGIRYVNQFDLETLRRFRAGWTVKNYTAKNELERLRALFRFAHDAKWVEENHTRKLKSPRVESPPALPFSKDEMAKILTACTAYQDKAVKHRPNDLLPMKAFVLTLRYSGLRIRDVVTLSKDKLQDGKLFLRTAKTGTHVRVPLPPVCLEALATISAKQYYFWSGDGLPKTRVANYQHALKAVFKTAEIVHGHAHRFRDTFAVELLLAVTPIERVSILLGHSSVKVTERHYSPWIQARQDQLEQDVMKTW